MNPQATYSFLGNGYLGRALGLERDSALQLGGFLLPEFDWVVSGGSSRIPPMAASPWACMPRSIWKRP